MSEHNQKFGFRYILPYQYVPGAKAPRFEKFLDEITCNRKDMAQVLLEFMGYALSNSSCYAEKALILYGEGSNGKSTFMEVLKALAGKDNYASLSLTALNKDTKRYMIDGKLFNIGEETSVKALGESEVFKTMVTGGEIDVKKLYSQDYTIKNRCKLIMACNELPKSADRSEGLYRRMILVPFDAKFTEESKDPHMKEKLVEELPGIFNMCVEAYRRLKANKYQFTQSIALMEAMESYRVENDNVLQWINERFQFTGQDEDFWFKDDMYDDYAKFCKEAGNYAISKISFCRSLKLRFPDITETRRVRPGLSLERHRAFIGCRMAYTI
jgi:putative DNA primase/helicase